MAKGDARANLRKTRTQISNARTSAQARAFMARQITQQKRAAEQRKLRAAIAARANAEVVKPEPAPEAPTEASEPSELGDPPEK
jgi:hypothetical protein